MSPFNLATLIVVFGLAGCRPDGPQEMLEKAVSSCRHDPDAALALAEEAARRGHVSAMFALAQYYSDGHMTDGIVLAPPDSARHPEETRYWYDEALRELTKRMASVDSIARQWIAIMYYQGVGTPVRKDQAIELMADVAVSGDAMAAFWVVHWLADEERLSEMDELISEFVHLEYDFAHRMRAESILRRAGMRGESPDVVAVVEAVAMSRDEGDSAAALDLRGVLGSIDVAAERGVPDAVASRSALREAGLW